jgi:hypothetical protein
MPVIGWIWTSSLPVHPPCIRGVTAKGAGFSAFGRPSLPIVALHFIVPMSVGIEALDRQVQVSSQVRWGGVSQQREGVEQEEDHQGADKQEYDKAGDGHLLPVRPTMVRTGCAMGNPSVRALYLRRGRGDVEGLGFLPVGGAAALKVPLIVALADQLLALRADWQCFAAWSWMPIRVSEIPQRCAAGKPRGFYG